MVDFGTELVN